MTEATASLSQPPRTPALRAAVFDYDGTLTSIRLGWQQHLRSFIYQQLFEGGKPSPVSPKIVHLVNEIENFIAGAPGSSSLTQMKYVRKLLLRRSDSGTTIIPAVEGLVADYDRFCAAWVQERIDTVLLQDPQATSLFLHGALAALEMLRAQDVELHLLSATPHERLTEELRLLRIDHLFHSITGATASSDEDFKPTAIRSLITSLDCSPLEILVVGDGPAELLAAANIGCPHIGVAINEHAGTGPDFHKLKLLESIGCSIVITEYTSFPAAVAAATGSLENTRS